MINWNWRLWLKPSPRPRTGGSSGFTAAMIAIVFVVLGYAQQNRLSIPPNALPWQPVDLTSPPGWIAHWQLSQLSADGRRCRAALAGTSEVVTALRDRKIADGCSFETVVRVDQSPIGFSPRMTATCGLTAALFWYQGALQRAAQSQMHAKLLRIDQLGTFACRNVNSEAVGPRSEHATANAIDIAGFHFGDGRTVTVARDYGKDSAGGRFLDAAHDMACNIFNTVLGPRYNRLHTTHFHLDQGAYRICS